MVSSCTAPSRRNIACHATLRLPGAPETLRAQRDPPGVLQAQRVCPHGGRKLARSVESANGARGLWD